MPSVNIASDGLTFLFAVNFHITKMSLLLKSVNLAQDIAELSCSAIDLEFNVREESTGIIAKVGSADVSNPLKQMAILQLKQVNPEENVLSSENPSASIKVDITTKNQMEQLMFRVTIQLVVIDSDLESLSHLMEFYNILDSHMSMKERVLLSLDGIRDVRCRLQSKAECVLSGRQRVSWDVTFVKVAICLPWENEKFGACSMIVDFNGLQISSKSNIPLFAFKGKDWNCLALEDCNDILHTLDLNNMYDYYEVSMDETQVSLIMPHLPQGLSVVDKFSASVSIAHCIIPDELILKQLEVHIIVSSLHLHFSADILFAFMSLVDHIHLLSSNFKQVQMPHFLSSAVASRNPAVPFFFSIAANFELFKLEIDLEDDRKGDENSTCTILFSLQVLHVKFNHGEDQDLWVSMREIKVTSYQKLDHFNSNVICSSKMPGGRDTSPPQALRSVDSGNCEWNESLDGCFCVHYIAQKNVQVVHHSLTLYLRDMEFHCYPYIVRLLVGFCDKLMFYDTSGIVDNSFHQMEVKPTKNPYFNFQRFGFSNFCKNGFVEWASMPLDQFPFVAIHNSGLLQSLDSNILIPEWTSFKVRDKNTRYQNVNPNLKASFVTLLEADDDGIISSSLDMQLDITNVSIHFHDASCILGSITLPAGKASAVSHSDQFDVLCSVEGLTLFSDRWTFNYQEFLWGPSLPNLFSVLNLRIRKGISYHTKSNLEISFGIQHVCCVIPPEYLAILIGYFSLDDWMPKDSNAGNLKRIDSECHEVIVYKFEILDSIIISPVESIKTQLLKLDLPQLHGSFIVNDANKASFVIFSEFLIPEQNVGDRADFLNIFGRDLHLCLLTSMDSHSGASLSEEKNGYESCTLVQTCSLDFWLRLPGESHLSAVGFPSPICILTNVAHCEFAAEDRNFICGFQALEEVVDQYAMVGNKSKHFKHDVLDFLQLTQSLKDNSFDIPKESTMAVTEMKCCVNSMSVTLIRLERDSNSRDMIARLEMGFILSATLKNDMLSCLNIQFSSLLLSASLNSIYLVKCSSDSTTASVLDFCFSAIQQNEIELLIAIPSLEIWFHLSDWVMVIDHVYSCVPHCPQHSNLDLSDSTAGVMDPSAQKTVQSFPLPSSEPDKLAQDAGVAVIVKSKNIGLSCYIPLWVSEEAFAESEVFPSHSLDTESLNAMSGGKDTKFLTITLQSRSNELQFHGPNLKLKTIIEKATGSVGICESGSVQSWPFFQLFQLGTQVQICEYQKVPMGVNVEVTCEGFDFWLSQQVLYFWHGIVPERTEADCSDIRFGSVDLKLQISKASLLLTDGRGSCNGPLIEIYLRNLHVKAILIENTTKFFIVGDLLVNYNNIHKVLWEPFLEPWSFEVNMIRNHDTNALLDGGIITDIQLESTTQLNLNITTSLCEVVLRSIEMVTEARSLAQIYEVPKCQRFQNHQLVENLCVRRYASYTIHNMTSLPFVFYVYQGLGSAENVDFSTLVYQNTVPPGASIPVYIDGTLVEQALSYRPASSSEGLGKKLSNKAGHYFMTIQFEGTSQRSEPISMDLVGLTYFEANFSSDKRVDANIGLLVPVVFDVSLQRYSKLIQLYSTVIFKNSTSMPLELRFDIPFGIYSKIVDPIHPGKEFPLPLHLAEAGHMRWRPRGNNYLWSEVNLSMFLSTESRSGFLRSLACNPSHPSSYLFRCCLSVEDISLSSTGRLGKRSHCVDGSVKQSVTASGQLHNLKRSKSRFIHRVTLSTPLIMRNYLPHAISITIEGGGATYTAVVREVKASFFHVDPSHDLAVKFSIAGFRPAAIKFPRAETFGATAKPSGTVLSLTETMTFNCDSSDGCIYVTVQKIMNSLSGARELCISVPFLLYNCTGFGLTISRSEHELKGNYCNVLTCYDSTEQGLFTDQKDGLHLLPSEDRLHPKALHFGNQSYLSKNHIISSKEIVSPLSGIFLSQSSVSDGLVYRRQSVDQLDLVVQEASLNSLNRQSDTCNEPEITVSNVSNKECLKAMPVMYSPDPSAAAGDIMVRVSRYNPKCPIENLPSSSWSSPFFLVAPSGPTAVLVPQPSTNSAAVISVTSHLLDTPLVGQTRAITFQPRYVVSNACSKPLCYKQKGTDFVFHLSVGQHSHLHWIDTSSDLLLVVCFDEPGWQWSGSFLPDHLGDTQVKMRNYVSGVSNIIRIEVQNADVIKDEKIIGNTIGKSGTNFIILSDDDTGFVPYRIDNFSKEVLSIIDSNCHVLEEVKGRSSLLSGKRKDSEEEMVMFLDYKEKISVKISFIGISVIDSYPQELLYASAKDISVEFLQNLERQSFSLQIESLQIDNQLRGTPYPVVLSFEEDFKGSLVSNLRNKDGGTKSKIESMMTYAVGISSDPKVCLVASKWRNKEMMFVSFEYISLRIGDLCLELDLELLLKLLEFFKAIRLLNSNAPTSVYESDDVCKLGIGDRSFSFAPLNSEHLQSNGDHQLPKTENFSSDCNSITPSLPEVIPIGAPWQKIFLLARRQNKMYVEAFSLAPVKMTLSFSSNPWMLKTAGLSSGESLIHRTIVALADIEGAQICLRELTITHHMASWESIQEILFKHYSRQFVHELYKVFGSAGVIGNPMGFARRVGLGVKDFLSVPAKGILQSPSGLISGMAHGTSSLLNNTLYAISDTATQFSKAAHKGILAFTFDNQEPLKTEQRIFPSSHSKGVINELFEGLTGLLQSPIRGAEKHGLPGVLSGFAFGVTGLVAKPAASVLEATGRTAQSIRNRSRLHRTGLHHLRVRLPRSLSTEIPLRPYSWEEAIGTTVLLEVEDSKFKDEVLVMCKSLQIAGRFVVLTENLILVIECSSLVDLGKSQFQGIVGEPEWKLIVEIALESVIHADVDEEVVHIVGSSSNTPIGPNHNRHGSTEGRLKKLNKPPTPLPLFQTNFELASNEEAEFFLRVLLSTIEQGREQGWGNVYLLHQSNLRK
ncbi:putative vacuolar protein sorting-associated protein 13A [Bienertia sinuspersici]